MAKIISGPLTGVLSGAVGNVVFSRGRYGPYIRSRTVPTLVQNYYTGDVRDRLILLSRAWKALDAGEKRAWATWAATHPITDRLGDVRVLQPSAAFIALNARVLQALGSQIDVPPVADSPPAISGQRVAAKVAGGTVILNWMSGAISATECLACWIAVYDSVGRAYYKNLLKLVEISAAAQSTGLDIGVSVATRFGPIGLGQAVKAELEVWDNTTGLISSRSVCETVVVA